MWLDIHSRAFQFIESKKKTIMLTTYNFNSTVHLHKIGNGNGLMSSEHEHSDINLNIYTERVSVCCTKIIHFKQNKTEWPSALAVNPFHFVFPFHNVGLTQFDILCETKATLRNSPVCSACLLIYIFSMLLYFVHHALSTPSSHSQLQQCALPLS